MKGKAHFVFFNYKIQMKRNIKWAIGIVFSLLLLWGYKFNIGFTWKEHFHLAKYPIKDTIVYEVDNAKILMNKSDVQSEILRSLEDFENYVDPDKYLLAHLDTIDQTYVLHSKGHFSTQLDTVSIDIFNLRYGKMDDATNLKKDTIILKRDYNDVRNYYFNAMDNVAVNLLHQKKVLLLDKHNNEVIDKIKLRHHKCGFTNYFARFELMDGSYLLQDKSILGL